MTDHVARFILDFILLFSTHARKDIPHVTHDGFNSLTASRRKYYTIPRINDSLAYSYLGFLALF